MYKHPAAQKKISFSLQLMSYGLVGFSSNLLGFLFYLFLTWSWLDPKTAVSVLYPFGALIGFYGHSKFAFHYSGSYFFGFLRYSLAHFFGFVTNLVILLIFVDWAGYPHVLVQASAVLVVTGILFFLFRTYVFPQKVSTRNHTEIG